MSDYPESFIEFGMTSTELAEGFEGFLCLAALRIAGPGREQYEKRDKNGQRFQAFEEMTPLELLQMAREEVQDQAVYCAMLDIRLARLTAAFEANEVIGDAR